jgi:hypothetical protein
MWGLRVSSSLISERVTGQKLERHLTQMSRKRQEKQRSEPQGPGASENSRNIGMMEKEQYRRQ